jgi:hypothetical protein
LSDLNPRGQPQHLISHRSTVVRSSTVLLGRKVV